MKRAINNALLAGFILLGLASYVVGETMTDNNGEKLKKDILKVFPNLTLGDVPKESPIPGLYEIVSGDQIFYISEKGYMFFGDIFSHDGKDLTAEKRERLLAEKVKRIPLSKALKIGDGPNTIVEFTDPDCPFCRRVNDYLSKRKDLTRYIFLFPLPRHKNAAFKSAYILSAQDQAAAHKEIFTGKLDKASWLPPNPDALKKVEESVDIGRTIGIRSTPNLWVNGTFVGGAELDRISALLKDGKGVPKQ